MPDNEGTARPTWTTADARLAALASYDILDTSPEQSFDDLTLLAARICDTPLALVSFIDRDRQWFKARIGFPSCETDLNSSVCKLVLEETDVLVIPALTQDPRTRDNPLVTGDPFIRFYAGAPLITPEGVTIGSLCVIDKRPRCEGLDESQLEGLRALARQVVTLLALRRQTIAQAQMAATIQESEVRHRAALQIAQLGTYEWSFKTGAVRLNDRAREMFGFAEGKGTTAQEVFDVMHPDELAPVMAAVEASAASHEHLDIHYRIKHPDGEYRTLFSQGEFLPGTNGEVDRAVGVLADMTDRVAADAALRESEAALRQLNETLEQQVTRRSAELELSWRLSQELLVIADPDGTIETINPSWMRLLGYEPHELVGRTFLEFTHPDDLETTLKAFSSIFKTPLVVPYAYRFRHKDGSYRWFSWTAAFEEGKVYASGRDLTREKLQAATLQESETRAKTFFESTNDYLFLLEIGADGVARFDDMNPACAIVMGLKTQQVIGQPIGDFLPKIGVADITKYAQLCLNSGEAQTYTAVREYRPGDHRVIEGRVAFVKRYQNGAGLVLFSGNDITERRRIEEALRQSQKMEAVGQLSSGLAHDFNNLLAGIAGSLELMQLRVQQGRFSDVDRYMGAAQGATRRAAALTHRLLAFSRRQTLAPVPTDVNRLCTGMQEMIQRTVGPSIRVEMVGVSGLWTALVDPPQLENALLNLCINARDAMPDGGRIMIETANKWLDERAARQQDIPEGQYLAMSVTDTGTGMPPEVIARVFEPFYTTKPIGEGTGLGLSMIYGFAKQSGGQVRIYSEVDQGTTVCIYLPRHYGDVVDEHGSTDLTALPRSDQGETVLVVDDEPTVRMLVADILEDLGYTAIEAGDSAAGLKVLQSGARIDLLITDVGLPGGMNGRQMADAGRQHRPDLRVLFITGYAENSILSNGHLAPGMAVLTKPFAVEAMAARIRSMIEAARKPNLEIGHHH